MSATAPRRRAARLAYMRRWAIDNKDKMRANGGRYYASNRATVIARAANWGRTHPAIRLASTRKRQADQIRRTPAWADLDAIRAIYEKARAMGPGWEVDHIIPLRGRLVSGLHVENNLQLMLAPDNRRKGNAFC